MMQHFLVFSASRSLSDTEGSSSPGAFVLLE